MTEAQAEAVRRVIAEMRRAVKYGLAWTPDEWADQLEAALGEAEPVNPLTSPSNR